MAVYLFSSLATSPNLFVNVPRIEASNRLKFEVECRVKLTTESLTGDLPILGLEDNSKGIKVFINDGSFGVLHSDYWSISKWLTDPAVRAEGNYTIKYRVDKEAGQNATARLYVDDVLVDEDLNYGTNETVLNAIDRLFRMSVSNSKTFYGGLYWFKFTDLVTPANNRHYVMDDYSDVDDTVVDRITGTETLTIGNNPNDGSIWVDDGASAEADFSLDTSLRYGSTFSGSFADLSAAPNNYLTITDGVHTAQVPITVTITDAPTNTGTFVSDAPLALPSAPLSGATDSVTGVGWDIGDVTVTFNAQTVATILNAPAGYGAVTVSATPVTDVFTASGWQAGDLPVENEQLLFETRDGTTVDTDLNIRTSAVDDELHFYLMRLDGSVESFLLKTSNIQAYNYGAPQTVPTVSLSDSNIKKNLTLSPAVSTVSYQRGGLRETNDSLDWVSILENVTLTGTPDATLDLSTLLSYVGAFKISSAANGDSSLLEKFAATYVPPNGSNGANGSLIMAGVDLPTDATAKAAIAEIQIPTLDTVNITDMTTLPEATFIQNWYDFYNNKTWPRPDLNDASDNVGWVKIINGRVVMYMYDYYDNTGNDYNIVILDDPTDFAGSTVQGFLDIDFEDLNGRYICDIPASWQASFGGNDLITGVCGDMNIISRSSRGHSVISWDSSQISASTPNNITATGHIYFRQTSGEKINGYSEQNELVSGHYADVIGVADFSDYCAIDKTTRFQKIEGWPLPDPSLRQHIAQNKTRCGLAFVPTGTNSLVFVGWQNGMRFGKGYHNYTLTNDQTTAAGYAPWDADDFDSVIWTYNLQDIVDASNNTDIDYSNFKLFDYSPWSGVVSCGAYDEANNLLYLVQASGIEGNFDAVVSVFNVNGVAA